MSRRDYTTELLKLEDAEIERLEEKGFYNKCWGEIKKERQMIRCMVKCN